MSGSPKTFEGIYPSLDFNASTRDILRLYNAETDCKRIIHQEFKQDIVVWEYGYYFLSLFSEHSQISRDRTMLVAYFSEAHAALRASFLMNLSGYQADAIAGLRRTHESTIKSLALLKEGLSAIKSPKQERKAEKIIYDADLEKYHQDFGLKLKKLYKLESKYTHGNWLKVVQAWQDMLDQSQEKVGVPHGPQIEKKESGMALRVGIFWLYALIRISTTLFQGQVGEYWLVRQEESLKMLKDHLILVKSGLVQNCEEFDACCIKLLSVS